MAISTVNIGSAPNDGTGDPLRTAFNKLNTNFINITADGGDEITVTDPTTSTDATLNNALQNIFNNSGGATPGLQAVTDVGNTTTNEIIVTDGTNPLAKMLNNGGEGALSVTDGSKSAFLEVAQIGLNNPSLSSGTTLADGILSNIIGGGSPQNVQLSLKDKKFIIDYIDYPLPTGASSPLATLADITGGVSDGDKGDITVSSSGTVWTIDNGVVSDAKIASGIDATKIADGSVSNTEFQRLDGVTSNIQPQIDSKQPKEIWLSNTSAYTLTSQTALQKAFNIGTNGALDAQVRTYKFEGLISLSSLSSSSGNTSFGFLGTATVASIRYTHVSMKGVLVSTPFSSLVTTTSQTTLTNNNTNTTSYMHVMGIVRISGAGTLIPAVGMSTAAAAVVDANSYFTFTELGTDTATNSTTGIS